jgi:Ca2+-binding EF-hand superfamily protein
MTLLSFKGLDNKDDAAKGKDGSPRSGAISARSDASGTGFSRHGGAGGGDSTGRWWTADLAGGWTTLQEIHNAELADGVVEKEVLEKVLIDPQNFSVLRRKVEEELERKEESLYGAPLVARASVDHAHAHVEQKKPSMEMMCARLGMTMSRLQWLHQLFEGFLVPNADGSQQTCNYPEHPAFLLKDHFRDLMTEVNPDLTEDDFAARFQRIDSDGSGMIEFDEFVVWVREDEVRVVGSSKKLSFPELADIHNVPVDAIGYLHNLFLDELEEGEDDEYPEHPGSIQKEGVHHIIKQVNPKTSDKDFETQFRMVDIENKAVLEFDELLEVIDMQGLPAELDADKTTPKT